MSKITFRADDDLVARIEAYDASKSEVMREALRAYLDEGSSPSDTTTAPMGETLDALVRERVDTLVDQRIEAVLDARERTEPDHSPQDINLTVNVDGERRTTGTDRATEASATADPPARRESGCSGCGETLDADAVYCPNCGEKANHRVFCDCGDELRSDWSFCPGCGRRTPAADVLERS